MEIGKIHKIGIIVSSENLSSFAIKCVDTLLKLANVQLEIITTSAPSLILTLNEKVLNKYFKSPDLSNQSEIKYTFNQLNNISLDTYDILFIFNDFISTENKLINKIFYIPLINNSENNFSSLVINHLNQNKDSISISVNNFNGKTVLTHRLKTYLHSYTKTYRGVLNSLPNLITDFIKRYESGNLQSDNFDKNAVIEHRIPIFRTILKQNLELVIHIFESLFASTVWNIGKVEMPISDFISNDSILQINWSKESNGLNFNADPFGLKRNEQDFILYEYYDHLKKKGVLKLKTSITSENDRIILEKLFHLSYPFLFQHENDWYCLPEQGQSNQLDLYKFDPILKELQFYKTIIKEIAAIDPTIIYFDNKWWLFCTSTKNKGADIHLYIYSSDKLDGIWNAHTLNPVKTDICSARPAGTPFLLNGKLIRPSQDSSKSYGGSIIFNEVIKLTPYEFQETEIKRIKPNIFGGKYPNGIHTISSMGNFTLIDGKRIEYKFTNLFKKILG